MKADQAPSWDNTRALCFAFPVDWKLDLQYFKGWNLIYCNAGHPVDELLMLELMLVPLFPSTKLPMLKCAHLQIWREKKTNLDLVSSTLWPLSSNHSTSLLSEQLKKADVSKSWLVLKEVCLCQPAESLQSNSRPLLTQLLVHLSQETQTRKYVPHTVTLKISKTKSCWYTTYTCQWHPSMPSFFAVSSSKLPIHEVCFEVVGLRQNRFGMDAQFICETTPDVSLAGLKCPPPHPTLTPFSQ